jgi:hypothetical protein
MRKIDDKKSQVELKKKTPNQTCKQDNIGYLNKLANHVNFLKR